MIKNVASQTGDVLHDAIEYGSMPVLVLFYLLVGRRWLGRFAGDMALVYGARGGVYLGGGIPARVFDPSEATAFRLAFFHREFQYKGRLSSFLEPIPIFVIKALDAGLRGAAVALSQAEVLC